jgi:L-iditol 2-dehydrogenase
MLAMRLTGIRQMRMFDTAKPKIVRDNDVLIRMTQVGVCGSDVHYYTSGKIGSQIVQYPFTVGHEGAGIVENTGSAVTRVKPGDRIAIEPAVSCLQCDQCRAGRPHTCRNLLFLGCPGQIEGCLKEYLVMPDNCCYPIPDSMSLVEASLSEPLAIGVYAVKLADLHADANIGIIGCGPIGLSVLLAVKNQMCNNVYVTDKIDARLKFAKSLGADWIGNHNSGNTTAQIINCEPALLDTVFECCGQQDAVNQALKILKPGGKLVMVGIPETDSIAFNMDDMRRKELCVQNVRRQNHCVQTALDMIASRKCIVGPMATHHFRFSETAEAFDLVANYRDGVIKAMINIS